MSETTITHEPRKLGLGCKTLVAALVVVTAGLGVGAVIAVRAKREREKLPTWLLTKTVRVEVSYDDKWEVVEVTRPEEVAGLVSAVCSGLVQTSTFMRGGDCRVQERFTLDDGRQVTFLLYRAPLLDPVLEAVILLPGEREPRFYRALPHMSVTSFGYVPLKLGPLAVEGTEASVVLYTDALAISVVGANPAKVAVDVVDRAGSVHHFQGGAAGPPTAETSSWITGADEEVPLPRREWASVRIHYGEQVATFAVPNPHFAAPPNIDDLLPPDPPEPPTTSPSNRRRHSSFHR